MKTFKILHFSILFFVGISLTTCKKDDSSDNSFNIFTIDDDKNLGLQVSQEIEKDPAKYPILDESQYPAAYQHLRRITNTILSSGKVYYKDKFVWQTKIIRDDSTLNAFCTPGGYIYVYTGIIKFLDSEDQLAGVMGHEIAHADRRHSTDQLTKIYGISVLLDVVLGKNQGILTEIAQGLISLQFSQKNETEADEYSVIYLYPTIYDAKGAAGFFKKIGQSNVPAFLSTHPDPGDRVKNIEAKWSNLGGKVGGTFADSLQSFKNSLP